MSETPSAVGNLKLVLQKIESSRSSPPSDVYSEDVTSVDQFLNVISSLDSSITGENYQLSLHHDGVRLEWEDQANKQGGRFSLFFATNIMAFRTFCILSVDWITGSLKFSDHILGFFVAIKNTSWNVQIWVDDGFDSRIISERYEYLAEWIKNVVNIQNDNYIIEFHVHPTYREHKTPIAKIKEKANQITSFQTCIKKLVGGASGSKKLTPPPFDYNIAIFHKRSRKDRREFKSYIDHIST